MAKTILAGDVDSTQIVDSTQVDSTPNSSTNVDSQQQQSNNPPDVNTQTVDTNQQNSQDNGNNDNSSQSNSDTNSTSISIESEDGSVTEYILDADGNATLNGEIVYDKQTLIDNGFEFNSSDEPNLVTSISSITGIELKAEDGTPLAFSDDVEGLAQREITIKNTFYKRGIQEALEAFYEENPDIYDMVNHKNKYGTLDTYRPNAGIENLTINSETDVNTLKQVYKEFLMLKGNDSDIADKIIKMAEIEETLRADSMQALSKIKEIKALEKEQTYNQLRQQQIDKEQNALKEYGFKLDERGRVVDLGVKDSYYDKIVKTGKVGNITIPNELTIEREGKQIRMSRIDLLAYFYNPIETEDGVYTLAEIDERNRLQSKDNWIVQGLRNLVGDDISKLEKSIGNSIKISNIKKGIKIKGNVPNPTTPKNAPTGQRRMLLD